MVIPRSELILVASSESGVGSRAVWQLKLHTILYLVQVKKTKTNYLEFEIDKITRSIENVSTGDSFPTDITHLFKADLKQVSKKSGWVF